VAALIIQLDMILLGLHAAIRTFYPDVWDMFGGHVEPGEQQPQTLVRELQQELGITPTQWTFLETLTLPFPVHQNETVDQLIVHLYLVTAWTGTPSTANPRSTAIFAGFL
jgi:8-oxo-dGTP diphosphatase